MKGKDYLYDISWDLKRTINNELFMERLHHFSYFVGTVRAKGKADFAARPAEKDWRKASGYVDIYCWLRLY
jgi:hypothetical protein